MTLFPFLSRLSGVVIAAGLELALGCHKEADSGPINPVDDPGDSTVITTFRHPGVVNSATSLDLIAAQANAGNTVRVAGYNQVVDYMS
jgi:hypothetical protein